jgi:hypothetical protein
MNQVEYQEGQANEPVPRVTVNVGDRMPLPDVPVPTTVMVPVTVVEVIPHCMSYGHPEPIIPGWYINCAQITRVSVDVESDGACCGARHEAR